MNILVINGSPKGKYSITLKTAEYIEKHNKEHKFNYINAGKDIRKFEKNFDEAYEELKNADLIIFAFPVYTFIAPSQLHKFVHLMKTKGPDMTGKYASVITTSKHFYDITAHDYIKENAQDMGMKYVKGLSADMEDLLNEQGRKDALSYFSFLCFSIQKGYCEKIEVPCYSPKHNKVTIPNEEICKKGGNVVIVADLCEGDKQLGDMIERFRRSLKLNTRVVNIHDFKFQGGCISCFNCSTDGNCIYKDGFDKLLRVDIQKSDAIVIAFSIKDHSLGTQFKIYDDRQFCNGHRTVTAGTPFAYIISGDYSKEKNLQMIINGRSEVGGNFLAGIATDEYDTDSSIDETANKLYYAVKNHYTQPSNFLGVGGSKIFRDLIYQMRGMMRADHKFFKEKGLYDFPQKKKMQSLMMYFVGFMMKNKKLKAKMGNKMNEGMIAPYKKAVEEN